MSVDLDGAGGARGGRRAARRLHGPRLVRRRSCSSPVPTPRRTPTNARRGGPPVDCGSIPGCCPHCSAYRPTRCATPGCRWRCCSPTRPAARPRCSPTPRHPVRCWRGSSPHCPAGRPDPGIRSAAVRLARGAAAADTADALGWTARTLHRRSVAAFGYGPAVLRRVLRFRRAMALLRAGVGPAEVAARPGTPTSRTCRATSARSRESRRPAWRRHTPGRPAHPQYGPCRHPQWAVTPGVGPSHLLGGWRRPESGCDGAGEGVIGRQPAAAPPGSGANRSTPVPSGSRTVA